MDVSPDTSKAGDVARAKLSTRRLLAVLVAAIFASEALIMLVVVPALPPIPGGDVSHGLLDAALLSLLSAPILLRYAFRPLKSEVEGRREVEADLRESESRFRSIANNSPDAIFRIGTDGTITYTSAAAEDITGYVPEDYRGKDFQEFIAEEDASSAREAFASVLRGEAVRDLRLSLNRKDGSTVPVEVNVAPVRRDDRVVGVQGMYRDISERVEAERRFESLVRDMNDGYVVIDQGGVITFANDALARVLGAEGPEEVEGRSLMEFIAPGSRRDAARTLRHALEDGELPEYDEYPVIGDDGVWRHVQVNPSLETDGGAVTGIRGVIRDVTDRQRAEEKTDLLLSVIQGVESAPDFEDALESTLRKICRKADWPYGEAWLPNDGGTHLGLGPTWFRDDTLKRFREQSGGRRFGPGEGLPGRVWTSRTPEWVSDIAEREAHFVRADIAGEAGIRAGFGVPIVADGEVMAVLVFFTTAARESDSALVDLVSAVAAQLGLATKRRKLEQEVRRTRDELETLNRIVRHDIRNDMQLVTGWGEVLEDHVDEDGREVLEKVLDASRDVIDLTFTARDYIALITEGESQTKGVDLIPLLDEAVAAARNRHGHASIRLEDRTGGDTRVRANDMLPSVFRNLLNNAVLHSDRDHPEIEIVASREDDLARVEVADDGPGVPPELRDTIFGKGVKGAETGGTGIGLYLVKTLVDHYGGDVRVRDNEPRGAVFTVTLPLTPKTS